MQPSTSREDIPGLEGPDYVALVIEWNDADDVEDAATLVSSAIEPEPERRIGKIRTIVAVLGALGALVLAAWGLRRLRTA